MISHSSTVAPQSEYYSDSLLTVPTLSHSIYNNLSMGFSTPVVALNALNSEFAKTPEARAIKSTYDAVQIENATPGISWTQWGANQLANMIGFGLNPITWGLGFAGGIAGKGVGLAAGALAPDALSVLARQPLNKLLSQPIGKYIPEMIGKEGAEKPLSLALLGENSLKTFGSFAGAAVPQGIVDNFNNDTGHINWGGVAREAGEMGAFGLAIGSIPFAWGLMRGKVNRALGRDSTESVISKEIEIAYQNGQINKKEYEWYKSYQEQQNKPDAEKLESLKSQASEIINDNGHTANTVTNEALFDILKSDDVTNLQGVIADQLTGDLPQDMRNTLSNFIVHNRMDYIRQNPAWLDGVRGYYDFVNKKLEERTRKTAEADDILEKHLTRGVKENMSFSQKELFRMMKKSGFEPSHIKHLPVTVPENLHKIIKLSDKINKLNKKIQFDKRRGLKPNKQTLKRIKELEKQIPKILTPKEELEHIRSKLLTENGLLKNWERSPEYHRLLDLSNVWHNARTLLDRINLEHEYNKQTAFRDLIQQVLRISDSDAARISNPDKVVDYLKQRIEGKIVKVEPINNMESSIKQYKDVPSDYESILKDQAEQIKNSGAKEAKDAFNQSTEKLMEFKSKENIFKNLISCVLGGLNG